MAKDDEKKINYLLQTQMKNKFCLKKFDIIVNLICYSKQK